MLIHYKSLPMQYTEMFFRKKNENLIGKILIVLIFSLKTHIVMWVHEYPQCMFWIKQFFYLKVGFKRVYISPTCFPDEKLLMSDYRIYPKIFEQSGHKGLLIYRKG